ncbi:MAG: hypothetical protein ACKV2Q_26540 [Planctomycetaceae bacterium]
MSKRTNQADDDSPEDWEYGPMTDEEITKLAEEAFIRMDQEEAEDAARRQTLNPQPPPLNQP